MEHAQRVTKDKITVMVQGLNPYFNGTCSKRRRKGRISGCIPERLNPYFNGTCSKSGHLYLLHKSLVNVLILILMEHAQREHFL